jgi:hypothetical protein
MKYYLHDSSSFDDEKITELYLSFGYEGLGLFYTLLEKIAKQEKPIKTNVLKSQLNVGKRLEKCWNFMEEIGIISSLNGETFNNNLLNFSEKYQIKKEKTRKKVSEWRDRQLNTNNVTGYVPNCNQPKVKESKENESKEKEVCVTEPPYGAQTQFEKLKRIEPDKINGYSLEQVEMINAWADWIEANAPRIQTLKQPLTNQQMINLRKSYESERLKLIMLNMNNYNNLHKYVSTDRTIRQWIKLEKVK